MKVGVKVLKNLFWCGRRVNVWIGLVGKLVRDEVRVVLCELLWVFDGGFDWLCSGW